MFFISYFQYKPTLIQSNLIGSSQITSMEFPDISGKDSSEDQDVPSKCEDNVADNIDKIIKEDELDILKRSSSDIKFEDAIDICKEEEEIQSDDGEYLMEQLEEAETELKRWREKKRKLRSQRRDMDSDEEMGPEMLKGNEDSDDGGPDDDDLKNDALAFRRILKRLDASEEKFICDVCDEMLKTPASLSAHLVRVHRKVRGSMFETVFQYASDKINLIFKTTTYFFTA